jgi:hypothetical protein
MSPEELKEKVTQLIDDDSTSMSKIEYSEFLSDLISDLELRLEANDDELQDEEI